MDSIPGIPLVGGIYLIAKYISEIDKPDDKRQISTVVLVLAVFITVLSLGGIGYIYAN